MLHPPQRQPGHHGGGRRHADRDGQDVRQAERQVAGEERLAGERDGRERDPQHEEDPEARGHAAVAATVDSTAAMTEICRGRAPTRRIAANRCSRRAADSRVAVAMKISTGISRASATTEKMRSTPLAPTPSSGGGVTRP